MAGCQASFGSPTKCHLRRLAGGTILCRMAELDSPFCLGPWETRGGDTGITGLRTYRIFQDILWMLKQTCGTCVWPLKTSPDQDLTPQLCLSCGPQPLPESHHLRSYLALDPFINQAGGSPEGPGVAFSCVGCFQNLTLSALDQTLATSDICSGWSFTPYHNLTTGNLSRKLNRKKKKIL